MREPTLKDLQTTLEIAKLDALVALRDVDAWIEELRGLPDV